MSFASPLFLLGLLPWTALTVWLLWGRRQRIDVPFLELWQAAARDTHARRKMQTPPIALALAITALALAILAAAGPAVAGGGSSDGPAITVILDRGPSMSMRLTPGGKPRFQIAAEEAASAIERGAGSRARIVLTDLPDGTSRETDPAGLRSIVSGLAPTARDTAAALTAVIEGQLRTVSGPLVVLSDRPLLSTDDRIYRVVPDGLPQNVGIGRLSARLHPRPQVMVTVRNDSDAKSSKLVVRSGGLVIEQPLALPPRGAERNYFLDLPQFGPMIEAQLVGTPDGFAADDQAWLMEEGSNPRIEARIALAPAVQRLVEIYRTQRPAGDASRIVALTDSVAAIGASAGIAVAPSRSMITFDTTALRAADHPVTRNVDWGTLVRSFPVADNAPEGWTPLLTIAGRTLLATRDEPTRQLWIGFDTAAWSGSPSFVIFWTAAFDWVGREGDLFLSHPIEDVNPEWAPTESTAQGVGVYQRADGVRRAFNSTPPQFHPRAREPGTASLAAALLKKRRAFLIGPVLLVLAIAFVAGAAATWRKQSPPATVWAAESLQKGGPQAVA